MGDMPDDLLSKGDAEALLEPHLVALRECVERGWADWHQAVHDAPFLATSRATSRANVVYDRISQRAEEYFDAQGVPTSRRRGFLTVALGDGRLILRFKKFRNGALSTAGIATQQRLAIEYQQPAFDGLQQTHAVVGYLPDDIGIGLEVVAVACTYASKVIWDIDLFGEEPLSAVPARVDQPQAPTVRSARVEPAREISNEE